MRLGVDVHGAARMAVWLASVVLDFRGEPAIARAWIERAHRLVDGVDRSPEHGWLDLHEGTIALDLDGDSPTARRLGESFRIGFLDLAHHTVELIVAGDRVTELFRVTGTHRGLFQGVEPTGRSVAFTGTAVFRIEGGRVVEDRTTVDLLSLVHQIGAAANEPADA